MDETPLLGKEEETGIIKFVYNESSHHLEYSYGDWEDPDNKT